MSPLIPLTEIIEAAEQLSPEDQEHLIAALRRHLAGQNHQRLIADVQEARLEFADGVCKPSSTDELMGEILS